MGEFYSDLKSILGLRMLGEVVLGMRRNDLLGLAGQLAYFFLLFFFLFTFTYVAWREYTKYQLRMDQHQQELLAPKREGDTP